MGGDLREEARQAARHSADTMAGPGCGTVFVALALLIVVLVVL